MLLIQFLFFITVESFFYYEFLEESDDIVEFDLNNNNLYYQDNVFNVENIKSDINPLFILNPVENSFYFSDNDIFKIENDKISTYNGWNCYDNRCVKLPDDILFYKENNTINLEIYNDKFIKKDENIISNVKLNEIKFCGDSVEFNYNNLNLIFLGKELKIFSENLNLTIKYE